MNRTLSKIISAGILAVIAGFVSHIAHVKGGQMGREAFLAKEAARYDRYFANPPSIVIEVIVCLILIGICLVAYELIAFVVLKILERINAAPV
jgi:hypothetical protein